MKWSQNEKLDILNVVAEQVDKRRIAQQVDKRPIASHALFVHQTGVKTVR